jgi:hypothetical protein
MAEIKISELSIGDWVEIDGEPAKAFCLRIAGGHIFKGVSGQMYRCCGGMDFEPIPLTPEILEKNGFVDYEVGKGWYVLNVADDLRVWLHRNSHDWTFQLMKWRPLSTHEISKVFIKHTHQLQHALRLAGVGKEIEV